MHSSCSDVTITLDDSPKSIRADSWRVFIRPTVGSLLPLEVPARLNTKLNWSELDKLTALTEIRYSGQDAGVLDYIAERPAVRELAWHKHDQACIDLKATCLTNITIECGKSELTVKLPSSGSTKHLILHASSSLSRLQVEAPNHGEGLHLTIWYVGKPGTPAMVQGLERIRALSIWHATRVNLLAFAECREIEKLDIRDTQTSIENVAIIARFTKLRSLAIKDCYDFGDDEFPLSATLPLLESIEFDGLRADDAKKFSSRLKGFAGLSIRGKRTEAWIRSNIGNPFFAWGNEYGTEIGSKACRAYKAAANAIDKLSSSATDEQLQTILKKFVAAFNRMDLDTVMREEIATAYESLALSLFGKESQQQARAWFEDWRDF